MTDARFEATAFGRAILGGAVMTNAVLDGADLSDVSGQPRLADVHYDEATTWPGQLELPLSTDVCQESISHMDYATYLAYRSRRDRLSSTTADADSG
jgi:hypothetical protein